MENNIENEVSTTFIIKNAPEGLFRGTKPQRPSLRPQMRNKQNPLIELLNKIEAQTSYTAMMTDTLLEEEVIEENIESKEE